MESTQLGIAYIGPDSGVCAECGRTVRLQLLTGYVRHHGNCGGGGRPPAKGGDIPENIPAAVKPEEIEIAEKG